METPERVRPAGVGALVAGAVSGAVLAVDGTGQLGGAFTGEEPTIYGPGQAALALAIAGAGVLLLVARRRVAVAALLGVIGVCAAQLAGTGLVGIRRWPLFWGCCTPETVTEQTMVRTLAAMMAVVCAAAAVSCVVVLVRGRYVRWTGLDLPVVATFAVALVVAIAGPRLVEGGGDDALDLAAWALMYSLPFAAGLALSALMQRVAALATVGAVAGSALVGTVGESFLELNQAWDDARTFVLAAAAAVAATRMFARRESASAEASTSSR